MNSLVMVGTTAAADAFTLMARDIQPLFKMKGAEEGLGDRTELLYKIADIVGERVAKDYETRSQQGYVSLGTLGRNRQAAHLRQREFKMVAKLKAFYSEGHSGYRTLARMILTEHLKDSWKSKKSGRRQPLC
jgi:hypothetical protein